MKLNYFLFAIAVGLVTSTFWRMSPLAQSESPLVKTAYRRLGNEGAITGTVSFFGRAPSGKRIDMSADPSCTRSNPRALFQDVVVRRSRLANVFVYVKSGDVLDGLIFETPSNAAIVDQRGCVFVPHVSGLQVNQTFKVLNSDSTTHNVHQVPKNNPDRNQSHPPGGDAIVTRFARPEIMVPIKCNQHPWMRAYVGVLPHPFFAVSNRNGVFKIDGLPSGTYTIVAWHERLGERTREITVGLNSESPVNFRFDAKDYPEL